MAQHELNRHEQQIARNIEDHQAVDLDEQQRSITAANQNSSIARIVNIMYFLFTALELLMLTRVILSVIGVNTANGFASFIYGLSTPSVTLFASLVQNPTLGSAGILEVTTLIAMVVWAIVAWLLGQLLWLTLSRPR